MDVDIQEMTGEALAVDLRALKSEIVAEIMRQIEDERRSERRREQERGLRGSALSRPQDLV